MAAKRIAETANTLVKVILFGSYARGDANEGSDLDFLVVEQYQAHTQPMLSHINVGTGQDCTIREQLKPLHGSPASPES